jgi:glycosyltransferase involved in cell wall biosynthesis
VTIIRKSISQLILIFYKGYFLTIPCIVPNLENADTRSLVPHSSQNFSDGASTSNSVRVLWLNWRDIKNPEAGGAEVFTHEVMRRLVKKGYEMTLFTSQFLNAPKNERIDGIFIIREGGKYTVYSKARGYCKKYTKNYDLVIDEINVRPFLTPKFLKKENKPILAMIHQISPEQFLFELPFPLSYIGYYYLEKKWLSYYKDISTLTVSDSTKKDLENLGFRKVSVIPEGLSTTPLLDVPQKEAIPTIVFIGRLKRHKLPDHAILAFSSIKQQITDAQLWVIGDGYMLNELRRKFNIKDVTFYGHVSSDLKFRLLSKSHIVLIPAIREGWGLVVTESNAMGTPVVAYDVPGLRDSIRNGETGILVKENSPNSLAQAAISLLKDQNLLLKYSYNALSFSRQFSWDNTAYAFDKIIRSMCTAK